MTDASAIVRRLNDAINAHDASRAEALLDPAFTYTGADGQVSARGPKAMAAFLETFFAAFPDLHDDVRQLHAAGDHVVIVEVITEGTHKGELMGLPPTGRRIALPNCQVWEVRDGKIFLGREYFDSAVMMQQLGVAAGAAAV